MALLLTAADVEALLRMEDVIASRRRPPNGRCASRRS